jgi:uncharacterized protein YceH (UPF0502 family)
MTLLLLRGPQTPGELRSRSERMHSFPDVEDTESALQGLAERFDALVVELPRQPGQRENRWAHLMTEGEDPLETAANAPPPSQQSSSSRAGHGQRLNELEAAVTEMREELRVLRQLLDR